MCVTGLPEPLDVGVWHGLHYVQCVTGLPEPLDVGVCNRPT